MQVHRWDKKLPYRKPPVGVHTIRSICPIGARVTEKYIGEALKLKF